MATFTGTIWKTKEDGIRVAYLRLDDRSRLRIVRDVEPLNYFDHNDAIAGRRWVDSYPYSDDDPATLTGRQVDDMIVIP